MKIKLNAKSVVTTHCKIVAKKRITAASKRLDSKFRTKDARRNLQSEIRLMRAVLSA